MRLVGPRPLFRAPGPRRLVAPVSGASKRDPSFSVDKTARAASTLAAAADGKRGAELESPLSTVAQGKASGHDDERTARWLEAMRRAMDAEHYAVTALDYNALENELKDCTSVAMVDKVWNKFQSKHRSKAGGLHPLHLAARIRALALLPVEANMEDRTSTLVRATSALYRLRDCTKTKETNLPLYLMALEKVILAHTHRNCNAFNLGYQELDPDRLPPSIDTDVRACIAACRLATIISLTRLHELKTPFKVKLGEELEESAPPAIVPGGWRKNVQFQKWNQEEARQCMNAMVVQMLPLNVEVLEAESVLNLFPVPYSRLYSRAFAASFPHYKLLPGRGYDVRRDALSRGLSFYSHYSYHWALHAETFNTFISVVKRSKLQMVIAHQEANAQMAVNALMGMLKRGTMSRWMFDFTSSALVRSLSVFPENSIVPLALIKSVDNLYDAQIPAEAQNLVARSRLMQAYLLTQDGDRAESFAQALRCYLRMRPRFMHTGYRPDALDEVFAYELAMHAALTPGGKDTFDATLAKFEAVRRGEGLPPLNMDWVVSEGLKSLAVRARYITVEERQNSGHSGTRTWFVLASRLLSLFPEELKRASPKVAERVLEVASTSPLRSRERFHYDVPFRLVAASRGMRVLLEANESASTSTPEFAYAEAASRDVNAALQDAEWHVAKRSLHRFSSQVQSLATKTMMQLDSLVGGIVRSKRAASTLISWVWLSPTSTPAHDANEALGSARETDAVLKLAEAKRFSPLAKPARPAPSSSSPPPMEAFAADTWIHTLLRIAADLGLASEINTLTQAIEEDGRWSRAAREGANANAWYAIRAAGANAKPETALELVGELQTQNVMTSEIIEALVLTMVRNKQSKEALANMVQLCQDYDCRPTELTWKALFLATRHETTYEERDRLEAAFARLGYVESAPPASVQTRKVTPSEDDD